MRYFTRLVLVASLTLGPSLILLPPAAHASPNNYVVVLRKGASVQAHLNAFRISPNRTYESALKGYAARLSDTQYARVLASPDVISVVLDVPVLAAPPHMIVPPPTVQPAQAPGNAVRRVGALLSPTAKIDGVDDELAVDIAVLDSGMDVDHPDLDVRGAVDCTNAKTAEDENGHGTLVGGFAAAVDNAIGRVGVAPGARLWSVRVGNKTGAAKLSSVVCGVDWVTGTRMDANPGNDVDVTNMSLNFRGSDTGNCGFAARKQDADPLHQAICASVSAGVTYVISAGNESEDAAGWNPAGYDEVIAVSALTDLDGQPGGLQPPTGACSSELNAQNPIADDTLVFFSNFGADVDIAAPGVCINSTLPDDNYGTGSGTSFAAPLVAGAAALYIANHPGASPATVRAALLAAADPGPIPGDPDSHPEGVLNVSTF